MKMSLYPADDSPTTSDSMLTYEASTESTKRLLLSTLITLICNNLIDDCVDSDAIADDAVTPAKAGDLVECVNRQDNTTNSVVTDQLIQYGWGFIVGDDANRRLAETVTFDEAFDDIPVVNINFGGFGNTTPDSLDDFAATTSGTFGASCGTVTTANFIAVLNRVSVDGADPGVFPSTSSYCYVWQAIGTKAR